MKNYSEIWRYGNNAGEGFAVGAVNQNINTINELGDLVIHSENNSGFAIYSNIHGETIVADANGPWAVRC